MSTELTNVKYPELSPAEPNDADSGPVAWEIIGRLARDWSRLQKAGSPLPETEGWFPPSMPRRGCEDC